MLNKVDNWNEEELKVKFIVPLLDLLIVDKPPLYKSFLDRNVGIEIGDIKLSGRIDWLLATGKKRPDTPFFMLHEYKPSASKTTLLGNYWLRWSAKLLSPNK
ncbi:MAG: hypothetical protein IPN94_27580 [Sphingobacteriales bacterium]|nr:hypothetical protein [Sphingobacteriales bacterium]